MAGINRRLVLAAAGAALVPFDARAHNFGPTLAAPLSTRPQRILVLGGTHYLGPALVRAAVARGHTVTLFNRGKTRPHLFKGIERRIGNRYPERDNGLSSLDTGEWDVVIDLNAYYPRLVTASCEKLKGRTQRYILMSSISVYDSFSKPGLTETSPVRALKGAFTEKPDLVEDEFGSYGARKAMCEDVVRQHFPSNHTIVRASGIIGAGNEDDDPSKFYWLARLMRDTVIAAPGDGSDPLQVIDVNDVAEFLLHLSETGQSGTFNAVGPDRVLTTRDYVETARTVCGGQARVVWTGQVIPNTPMWAPSSIVPGFARISYAKGVAAGLRYRPLRQSIESNFDWFRLNHPLDFDFAKAGTGPSPEDEAKALNAV